MAQKADGMSYAPTASKVEPWSSPASLFSRRRIWTTATSTGSVTASPEAGAELRYVYDPDPEKVKAFVEKFPQAKPVDCLDRIFEDDEVKLVAAAAIPSERGPLGCRVMQAGRDYFTDKCPFTTLEQLESARKIVAETGRKYMVYYSERVHVESAWYVDQLIQDGVIGDIVHMEIFGPHRLSKAGRPDWFFEKAKYGGILTDIASHQFDQFLHYTRSKGGGSPARPRG